MHLGNVFSALLAWLSVRSRDGEMVLRMEDLDTQRTSAEYARILREDLTWLGLTWDRETPPQSTLSKNYDRYFDRLREAGLLYPCYCTRSQLHSVNAPHLSDGTYVYPGTCRDLTEEQRSAFHRAPAWRAAPDPYPGPACSGGGRQGKAAWVHGHTRDAESRIIPVSTSAGGRSSADRSREPPL